MRCLLNHASGQTPTLRLFNSLELAEQSQKLGIPANDENSLAVPAEAGLRVAVFVDQQWLPGEIAKPSFFSPKQTIQVRTLAAGETHSGRLMTLSCSNLISSDYRAAEKLQLAKAEKLCRQGAVQFYRGHVFLPQPASVLKLSRDSLLAIDDGRGPTKWRVLDILPRSAKIVLVEPSERNDLGRNRSMTLRAADLAHRAATLLSEARFTFAYQSRWQRWRDYFKAPRIWAGQMRSNTKGIIAVLDMILFRPVPGGLIPENHPWTTGIDAGTGRTVWSDNVIFATPRKAEWNCDARYVPDSDEIIVRKVGQYLAGMVKKTVSTLEHPFGTRARMPAAIGYIHGAVHYNSGIILFNDYAEGIHYLSDPRFVSEMQRFARESKREIMIMFRERVYEPKAYAYFAGMIRTVLPWFSNTNGPIKPSTDPVNDKFLVGGKVMWGNPSPYPVVNPITGNWIHFVRDLAASQEDPAALQRISLPPIGKGLFFREQYQGNRQHALRHERWLAIGTAARVRARGDNLFFVSESDLAKERELAHQDKPAYVNTDGSHTWPVVIIGGGAAGLSIAQELKQRGVNALILEKSESVGATWRQMPAERKLVSIWSLSELANTPKEIRPTELFASFDRFAKYLENYARHHKLSIATGAQVVQTEALAESERFVVTLADGTKILARDLVNCTGYAGNPFTPAILGADRSRIPTLHFAQYKNPAQVATLAGGRGKRILVVGKGLSAGQAVLELEKTGFKVDLSIRGALRFGPSQRGSAFRQKFLPFFDRLASMLGRDSGPAPFIPMEGDATEKLVASKAVAVKPAIAEFENDAVIFTDGVRQSYDVVLFCTGYEPVLSHLSPEFERTQARFHNLGTDGGRTSRSRFLRGIREDAAVLAETIAAKH